MRIVIGTWASLPALCEADALYLNLRHRAVLRGRLWPVPLSKHQMTIMATVCGAAPATNADIVDRLYDDDSEGGPDDASQIVAQLVHTLNKKIKPLGLRVRARGWQGYELLVLT